MFQGTGVIKKPRARGEKYAQGRFVLDRKSGKIIPQFSSEKKFERRNFTLF